LLPFSPQLQMAWASRKPVTGSWKDRNADTAQRNRQQRSVLQQYSNVPHSLLVPFGEGCSSTYNGDWVCTVARSRLHRHRDLVTPAAVSRVLSLVLIADQILLRAGSLTMQHRSTIQHSKVRLIPMEQVFLPRFATFNNILAHKHLALHPFSRVIEHCCGYWGGKYLVQGRVVKRRTCL
jgi:hypothetical protein